ncbi:hypothetical protein LTR97_012594 [Elasticomyces elasticus]|uniref:Uncharacterized protein n=1 Tax=Elasticomyces elasticus TaxID=574655 RepID=A0AAN7VY44_9PEZI|nr:hypothetical protein LTR97_012594 [Elasticomyces elasticus]
MLVFDWLRLLNIRHLERSHRRWEPSLDGSSAVRPVCRERHAKKSIIPIGIENWLIRLPYTLGSIDGICGMASVLTLSDEYEEVIPPVMKGAAGIIAGAVKEPSIKPFVYTSSSTAVLMPQPYSKSVVTKVTWDQAILDKMQNESKPAAFDVGCASKTRAEKPIRSAVEKHNPNVQVATVLPSASPHMISPFLPTQPQQ